MDFKLPDYSAIPMGGSSEAQVPGRRPPSAPMVPGLSETRDDEAVEPNDDYVAADGDDY